MNTFLNCKSTTSFFIFLTRTRFSSGTITCIVISNMGFNVFFCDYQVQGLEVIVHGTIDTLFIFQFFYGQSLRFQVISNFLQNGVAIHDTKFRKSNHVLQFFVLTSLLRKLYQGSQTKTHLSRNGYDFCDWCKHLDT